MDQGEPIFRKPVLQIQPLYASRDQWEALALQEGLSYEVLELCVPPALAESGVFHADTGSGDAALSEEERSRRAGIKWYNDRARWYKRSGRVSSIHGAFIDVNPASSDAAFRALSRQRCHESCALGRLLGAGNIIFHSSCETFLRGTYLDMWAGQCASFFEMLPEIYGLHIWIENSQDTDAGPISELMKRISNPRIGVCLDLGHVNYSRMPMEQWFEILGDRIGYLHLSDNGGLYDDHLPLGDGTVDWATADALWKGLGRDTYLTLEVGPPEGVRRSIAYLKERGLFGMHAD